MIETLQRGLPTEPPPEDPDHDGWWWAELDPDPVADPWPPQGWDPDPADLAPPRGWEEPQEPQESETGRWDGGFAAAVAALQVLDGLEVGQCRDRLAAATLPDGEAGLIDLLRGLEDLKSAACALQARAAVRFDAVRRQSEADRGMPVSRRGIGVGAEVALARRESPYRGGRLMGLAKALVGELPQTLAAMAEGILNEWRVTLIARETACLDPASRGQVDAWLAAHLGANPTIGDARLVAEVRRKVIEIDQAAVLKRRSAAAGGRRVTLRPLPDGMVQLTAILGLHEGVAVYAALQNAANAACTALTEQNGAAADGPATDPDDTAPTENADAAAAGPRSSGPASSGPASSGPASRGPARAGTGRRFGPTPKPGKRRRGSRMADALVASVTGNPAHDPGGVDLTIVITAEALLSETEEAAHVQGYGSMPASWVRQLIADTANSAHEVTLRRLFRGPGRTVRMETASRFMTPALRHLIAIRDQQCRTPWCGAPLRHTDHVYPHADGGASSWVNGQGLCEASNYTKQQPGWHARARHDPDRGHVVTTTTPTGHAYESTQPTGPGDN